MKIYKDVTKTEKQIDTIACDICKSSVPQYEQPDLKKVDYKKHLDSFIEPSWDIISIERSIEAHTLYGESGEIVSYSWDICPSCFEKVIVKALEKAGCEPTIDKRDY